MREDELFALLDGRLRTRILAGRLPHAIARAIGGHGTAVYLSHETMVKQQRNHSDLRPGHYLMIPVALECGLVLRDTAASCYVLYTDPWVFRCCFRVVVKATGDGGEMYAVSFHKLRDRKYRNLHSRRVVIRPHWP